MEWRGWRGGKAPRCTAKKRRKSDGLLRCNKRNMYLKPPSWTFPRSLERQGCAALVMTIRVKRESGRFDAAKCRPTAVTGLPLGLEAEFRRGQTAILHRCRDTCDDCRQFASLRCSIGVMIALTLVGIIRVWPPSRQHSYRAKFTTGPVDRRVILREQHLKHLLRRIQETCCVELQRAVGETCVRQDCNRCAAGMQQARSKSARAASLVHGIAHLCDNGAGYGQPQ